MEALFYQTQDLDLSSIAQALVLEYQAKGFEAQQFGDVNNVTVQLRHESTLRAITGFNKALASLNATCSERYICQSGSAGLGRSDSRWSSRSDHSSSPYHSRNRSAHAI